MNPKLILVIELCAPVELDEFRRAGLQVLDGSDKAAVVAFSDDPAMAAFLQRLDECAQGTPAGKTNEPYAAFVDAIEKVREMVPADRMEPDLLAALEDIEAGDDLRLDIELWHPEDRDRAMAWINELRDALRRAGGRMLDAYVNDRAGVVLSRVYLPRSQVAVVAGLDAIANMRLLPRPALTVPQYWATSPDDLPPMAAPNDAAPIVGLIDSGIASAHPLVGPAVLATEALSGSIPDGEDRHGHGTMVAGLILHGRVDRAIARGLPLRPFCRLISVAALDHKNLFPDTNLWERDLVDAIEWCAAQGASIINLSIGDSRRPFKQPRQFPAGALVDELARRLGLVMVVAAGNAHLGARDGRLGRLPARTPEQRVHRSP